METVSSYHTVISSLGFSVMAVLWMYRAPVLRAMSPMAAITGSELLPYPGERFMDVICDTGPTAVFPRCVSRDSSKALLTLRSKRVTSYPWSSTICRAALGVATGPTGSRTV